jgi:protein-disulfide isomerase
MSEKKETGNLAAYTPLLVILLLVAVFFVGRFSSQIEMMDGSLLVKEKAVDNKDGVIDQNGDTPISVSGLKEMAKKISLKQKDFDSCLDEGKFEQRIKDDMVYGAEIGVSGTPSFFINKVMVVGSQPVKTFEAVIDYELAGGDWDNPTEEVGYLVDKNPNNGEVTIVDEVKGGVGAVKGAGGASVKIVEFSDFECPYCAKTIPTIDGLFEKYGDDISLEYRHYPLSFHANAQKMAEASECAREQGKFWEMHDLIFESQ